MAGWMDCLWVILKMFSLDLFSQDRSDGVCYKVVC